MPCRFPFARHLITAASLTVGLSGCSPAHDGNRHSVTDLQQSFQTPPTEAKPRVWWHWMNGNISAEGIRRDLDWMDNIGIGGVQNFDAAMQTPQIVDERLVYMSPAWQQAFKLAVQTAADKGMEFGIAASPGWSETGGPWVPAQDGMKKLVWSETRVDAAQSTAVKLPPPPNTTGPFQTLPMALEHGLGSDHLKHQHFEDAMVLAYPVTAVSSAKAAITIDGNAIAGDVLSDGDLHSGVDFPAAGSGPVTVSLRYDQPQTIRSLQLFLANAPSDFRKGPLQPELQVLDESGEWQSITRLRLSKVPTTASFEAVIGQEFRLVFGHGGVDNVMNFAPAAGVDPRAVMGMNWSAASKPELMELSLSPQARVNAYEQKAGFSLVYNYYGLDEFAGSDVAGVAPSQVLDVSQYLQADGTLNWQPEQGQWQVLRLGYSLTGKTNHPATPEATGLEVDKHDADAVERYLRTYLDNYRDVVGGELMGEQGLQALLTDSIEAGPSNWTPKMVAQFKRLRGYDPTPWMPALTGVIIGSREQSDRFLYDYRRTLADLISTEHYGTVARVAHDYGLTVYGESLEGDRGLATLGDDLEMRRFADIPMAAMWTHNRDSGAAPKYKADMRGAASVAHLYGKPFVAAESLTSVLAPWAYAPADLQPMIDQEFLQGINRPVIHSVVHQPVEDKQPGLSLHIFGQFFSRHETWAPMAKPWINYMARNSYLLQQGRFVADVAYFYGEETPVGALLRNEYAQDIPTRYGYDFVSPDAVMNLLQTEGGDLVTAGGARYRVLFLSGTSQYMTLPVLKRLGELVAAGATVVGAAPTLSPSLADDDSAFAALVAKLWSGDPLTRVGKGRVINSRNVEDALQQLGVQPDFVAHGVTKSAAQNVVQGGVESAAAPLQFVHRAIEHGDIYYVSNQGDAQTVTAQFRVTGKAPQFWYADTGQSAPASYRIQGEVTEVELPMAAHQSYFVVFTEDTRDASRTVAVPQSTPLMTLTGEWQVSFEAGRGAPESMVLPQLAPLSEHADKGVKYFSGIATYHNQFTLAAKPDSGSLLLDLGQVGDVAEVWVNGQAAGIAWKPPYQVDIDALARVGDNKVEIRVANLWVNRLIGDLQPDVEESEKVTYTTIKTYLPNAPLRPSGLMGPVTLLQPAN
ncbi:glycoside hydrolase [Aestuariicella hydrocarbonica]|uniref:Glycoside hydrolase n=1 Tax=Pseudomaricurvus hydrocarbonicus TaxID=1470433 RepID=A0A9E5JUC6_9GAMM|nr:glycosyl hydrolase [Aestuariicella hydrocarbonica]NHO65641.1 glycoside hydrolase [Aestuariicella hydrocarbonica]